MSCSVIQRIKFHELHVLIVEEGMKSSAVPGRAVVSLRASEGVFSGSGVLRSSIESLEEVGRMVKRQGMILDGGACSQRVQLYKFLCSAIFYASFV